jgi:hypothetical protein
LRTSSGIFWFAAAVAVEGVVEGIVGVDVPGAFAVVAVAALEAAAAAA